jgi:hypothetical protein
MTDTVGTLKLISHLTYEITIVTSQQAKITMDGCYLSLFSQEQACCGICTRINNKKETTGSN